MPLDLQAISDTDNQKLLDLVNGQQSSLPDTLARYAKTIRGARGNFFSNVVNPDVNQQLSNLGLTNTGQSMARNTNSLESSLAAGLNQERFNRTNQNIGLNVDTQNQLRNQARTAQLNAQSNARSTQLQNQQQTFAQSQLEQQIQDALEKDALAQQWFTTDQQQQDQFANQSNNLYDAALSRAFGSLLGSGVSSYATSNMLQSMLQNQNQPIPQLYNPSNLNYELRANSGFVPQIPFNYGSQY